MICAQVHTQCHKSCARYLYFKRNAEKFGVPVIRKVRAIGRKIRYLQENLSNCHFVHLKSYISWSGIIILVIIIIIIIIIIISLLLLLVMVEMVVTIIFFSTD
jgi:hypothetical protein